MDKTAIRNFAVKARRKLIEDITHKAYEIGITTDKILDIETFEGGFRVKAVSYTHLDVYKRQGYCNLTARYRYCYEGKG